jgi:hypothetical protein
MLGVCPKNKLPPISKRADKNVWAATGVTYVFLGSFNRSVVEFAIQSLYRHFNKLEETLN